MSPLVLQSLEQLQADLTRIDPGNEAAVDAVADMAVALREMMVKAGLLASVSSPSDDRPIRANA